MNTGSNQNVYIMGRDRSIQATSCTSCIRKSLCPAAAQEAGDASRQLQKLVKPHTAVCTAGDKCDSIYVVKSGFFKSYFIDCDGVMQVTGFYFPGEVFGIDGIESGKYQNTVEALDTGSICRISLADMLQSASTVPGRISLQQDRNQNSSVSLLSLVKIMSRSITRDRKLIFSLGKMCALRRFSTFLLDISQRMEQSGFRQDDFRLCMSRTDISNYLCLALETVSRLFTQLQTMGIIAVERRNLAILDMQALQALVDDERVNSTLLEKAG